MPSALHLKKDEVDSTEKRRNYTVGLVGCGIEALMLGLTFAEAGFKVVCIEVDQSAAKRLTKGTVQLGNKEAEAKLKTLLKEERITVTSDLKSAVAKSDVNIIAVNVRIDKRKNADYSEAENICKQVGAALHKGSLVVYSGFAAFGFVENVIKEALEDTSGLKVGEDLGLVYEPPQNCLNKETFIVAADEKLSMESATLIFGTISRKSILQFPSIKTAELAALFGAAERDVSIALANEFASFCEDAEVDFEEAFKLFSSSDCVKDLKPSISEERNRTETYLLMDAAESLGAKLRLPLASRQVNEDMAKHALNLASEALHDADKTLRRAKVAILGSVEIGSAAETLVEQLLAKGARVNRFGSPARSAEKVDDLSIKRTLNEAVEASDCVVLLSDDEPFCRLNLKKLHALMKSPAALVDLTGSVEPAKAQSSGFMFRGLGRGNRKK